MTYKYIGVEIFTKRDIHREVQRQAHKRAIISGYFRDIIWRNGMFTENKIKI